MKAEDMVMASNFY